MAYPMPVKPSQPTGAVPSSPLASPLKTATKDSSWLKGLITLIVVLVIIGGGIYLVASYTGLSSILPGGQLSLKSDWQAVFLANGQVYFGKVEKIDDNFLFLKDIYYLQVVTLQDTIGQPSDVQTQPEQRLTLIKLGNEIHGPRDEMAINRDQVVLIEDLKNEGRVVTAINDYLNKQKAGQ